MSTPPAAPAKREEPRLGELAPGAVAEVLEIDASISSWRERLIAYGLAPGRLVEIVQQAPVTVVRVERIDLAFESRIAAGILVSPASAVGPACTPGAGC